MTSNPYAPPSTEPAAAPNQIASVHTRRGPALYIAVFGLIGGMAAAPLLMSHNGLVFGLVLVGCLAGGVAYRVRSRNWPNDPTVFKRQILYSVLAIALPPGTLMLFPGSYGSVGAGMIGMIVGVSVACGIWISGTRRGITTQDEELQILSDRK